MSQIVFGKMIEMLIILILGIVAFKSNIIDEHVNKRLSNLLLMIVSPLVIVVSYQIDFDYKHLYGLLWAVCISVVTYIITIIISNVFIKTSSENYAVEKISAIYSNCGFIGIPLINGILGAEGVFYMTAYMAVFNVVLWTHGVLVMEKKADIRNTLKNLMNPAVFAVFIGLFMFVTRIRLPDIVYSPLDMVASMNTPLAMIVAGGNIAQSSFLKSLKNKRIYYINLIKLVIFPVICCFVLMLFPVSFEIAFTIWIGVACPTGASVIMFSERYDKNTLYASELFVLSTVLSIVTIPVLSVMASYILA